MEQVPNTFPDLFIAYTVVWGIIVVYMVTLWRKVNRLEQKLRTKGTDNGIQGS
jgi:CcmD family protein